jgi:hypothetical protein
MTTVIAYCDVDDVDAWVKSTRRQELLGALGITGKVFTDPAGSSHVALCGEVPDMAALQAFMQSSAAEEAMRADGVHLDSFVLLVETADHI